MARRYKGKASRRARGGRGAGAKRARREAPSGAPPETEAVLDASAEQRTFRRGLPVVLAGAAVLKAIYLVETLRIPHFRDFLLLDSKYYKQMAEQIAAGDWIAGNEAFTLGPLYSYLLALLQQVAGDGTAAIFVAQQLLGLGSLALTAWLGRALFGARAGLAAAALLALYGPVALMELKVMASTATLFLGLAGTVLLLRAREEQWRMAALLPGLLLGLTCLARPNTLLFCPLAVLWLAWDGRGLRAAGPRLARGRLVAAAIAGAGIALAIAPATWRNYAVEGEPILISSQGGITFYQANNPRSVGTFVGIAGFSGTHKTQSQESKALAEGEAGHPLTTAEVSSFWFHKGLRHIRKHPGHAISLALEKASYWAGSQEFSTEYVLLTERRLTRSLWLMPLPFAVLLGLAIAGVRLRSRSPAGKLLLLLFIGVNLASVMLFYFSSRYRLPATPFLCILAGAGAATLFESFRHGRPSRGGFRLAIPALAVFTLSAIPWHPDYEFQAANQWYNLGNEHFYVGDYDGAEVFFKRALVLLDQKSKIHFNLGVTYKVTGRWSEAAAEFERVLASEPDNAKARSNLRDVRQQAREAQP